MNIRFIHIRMAFENRFQVLVITEYGLVNLHRRDVMKSNLMGAGRENAEKNALRLAIQSKLIECIEKVNGACNRDTRVLCNDLLISVLPCTTHVLLIPACIIAVHFVIGLFWLIHSYSRSSIFIPVSSRDGTSKILATTCVEPLSS